MKKYLVILSMAAVLFTGCYGNYALFNKVKDFTGSFGDKWINSVVNFVAWCIPAYEVSLFVDVLILNTIQFWTGSNPIASNDTYYEKDAEGNSITASKNNDGTLSVSINKANGEKTDLEFQRDEDVIRALDQEGNVVGMYMTISE